MNIERLFRLHKMIEQEITATPTELAKRLHIKTRQFHYLLEELRFLGAQIEYSRRHGCYRYVQTFDFFDKINLDLLYKKENKIFLQEILKKIFQRSSDCSEE